MSEKYPRGEYPMEFSNPNTAKMQAALALAGLDKVTTNPQGAQKVRDRLVASGQLFTLDRPLWGGRDLTYRCLHPEYTQAALTDAPNLKDYTRRHKWLAVIVPHLQEFAATPLAREIIGNGLVTHFTRIADETVDLPVEGGPWFPKYAQDRSNMLGLMGIDSRSMPPRTKKCSQAGKAYVAVKPLAEHTAWTIPGIENPATKDTILDKLSTAQASTIGAIGPLALFMAGSVIVPETDQKVPIEELFAGHRLG